MEGLDTRSSAKLPTCRAVDNRFDRKIRSLSCSRLSSGVAPSATTLRKNQVFGDGLQKPLRGDEENSAGDDSLASRTAVSRIALPREPASRVAVSLGIRSIAEKRSAALGTTRRLLSHSAIVEIAVLFREPQRCLVNYGTASGIAVSLWESEYRPGSRSIAMETAVGA